MRTWPGKIDQSEAEKHQGKQHFLPSHVCHLWFIMDFSRSKWLQKPCASSSNLSLGSVLLLPMILFQRLYYGSVLSSTLGYGLQHKLYLHSCTHLVLRASFKYTDLTSHCLALAFLWSLNVRHHDNLNLEPFTPKKSITV